MNDLLSDTNIIDNNEVFLTSANSSTMKQILDGGFRIKQFIHTIETSVLPPILTLP